MPCFHDPSLLQLQPMDEMTLDEVCQTKGVRNADTAPIINFERVRMLDAGNAFDLFCKLNQKFELLVPPGMSPFSNHPLDNIQLTSVGIALANANIRRRTGQEFDLGFWIK